MNDLYDDHEGDQKRKEREVYLRATAVLRRERQYTEVWGERGKDFLGKVS